jgi:hypothetical protein
LASGPGHLEMSRLQHFPPRPFIFQLRRQHYQSRPQKHLCPHQRRRSCRQLPSHQSQPRRPTLSPP